MNDKKKRPLWILLVAAIVALGATALVAGQADQPTVVSDDLSDSNTALPAGGGGGGGGGGPSDSGGGSGGGSGSGGGGSGGGSGSGGSGGGSGS